MTTTIIRDELGSRKPLISVALPPDAVDQDGNSLAGLAVYVPASLLMGADGRAIGPGSGLAVQGAVVRTSQSFTRPADTTTYASGDLVANSTTVGSVSPMTFDLGVSDGLIRAAKFKASNSTLASGSTFRLHLWSQAPTVTGGDNAPVFAAAAGLATSAGYLGYIDCTADVWFADGAEGRGAPLPDIHFDLGAGTTVYGLLEARGAITPASGDTITCTIAGLAA